MTERDGIPDTRQSVEVISSHCNGVFDICNFYIAVQVYFPDMALAFSGISNIQDILQ